MGQNDGVESGVRGRYSGVDERLHLSKGRESHYIRRGYYAAFLKHAKGPVTVIHPEAATPIPSCCVEGPVVEAVFRMLRAGQVWGRGDAMCTQGIKGSSCERNESLRGRLGQQSTAVSEPDTT